MSNQKSILTEMQSSPVTVMPMVNQETGEMFPGFERGSLSTQVNDNQTGTLSAMAREESELRASVVMAKRFPRSELDCYNKIIRSCQRPSFAATALYRFPRGGTDIEGPSVDLARECARCWGSIRTGLRIVSEDENWIHIKGYAFDMETNIYVEMEDKFSKLIPRKNKSTGEIAWLKPDERDLRELVNRRGAICMRNAILQVIPPDVVDDAKTQAKATLVKMASGGIKADREGSIRKLVMAFSNYAITVRMIEEYLGHKVDLMNDEEMANLRAIYKSLLDGQAKREDFFIVGAPVQDENATEGNGEPKSRARRLIDKLEGGKQ